MAMLAHALAVALGERDDNTLRHCERVIALSCTLGMQLGLEARELGLLANGALLHDIGKIGVPDRILRKPGRFTPDEWKVMQQHSVIGERIAGAAEGDDAAEVARIIRHHHEHYDGTGYPDSLQGDEIPACSRIIAIVDAYDAMSRLRPYHLAKPHQEILDIMHGPDRGHFDPDMLSSFTTLIEGSALRAT